MLLKEAIAKPQFQRLVVAQKFCELGCGPFVSVGCDQESAQPIGSGCLTGDGTQRNNAIFRSEAL
jgi:hypothetical protein